MLAAVSPCFPAVSALLTAIVVHPHDRVPGCGVGGWEEVVYAQSSAAIAIDLSVHMGLVAHKLLDAMLHRIRDGMKMTM